MGQYTTGTDQDCEGQHLACGGQGKATETVTKPACLPQPEENVLLPVNILARGVQDKSGLQQL